MAFSKKYESTFYDNYNHKVAIWIYQDQYSGATFPLTIKDLSIKYNGGGIFDSIISLSASLTIINTGEFDDYDDMLKNKERQYKVKIFNFNTGQMYFEGYLICDEIQQQLINQGEISLLFTDYLKRLEDIELELTIGETRSVIDYLQQILALTSLYYPIYVNSRLFPEGGDNSEGKTLFDQAYIDSDLFFKNLVETKSAYEVLNSILKSFRCYLYQYDNAWYIERYGDLMQQDYVWTKYEYGELTGESDSTKYAEYNRQANDFVYINISQTRNFVSGLKTFELKLNDETYDTLVYNNAVDASIKSSGSRYFVTPMPALLPKQWYISPYANEWNVYTGFYGIEKAMHWQAFNNFDGLYYKFKMSFNDVEDTTLKVSFKSFCQGNIPSNPDQLSYYGRFFIYKMQPSYNYYVALNEDSSVVYTEYNPVGGPYVFESEWKYVESDLINNTIEFKKSINISDLAEFSTNGEQEFIFGLLPVGYRYANGDDDIEDNTFTYLPRQNIGDIIVSVNAEDQDNNILASVEDDFVKKESLEIDLFDINSLNLKNGLFIKDASLYTRVYLWSDDQVSSLPLVDHIIRGVTSYTAKTRSVLTASAKMNAFPKPLSILTDNNLNMNFILSGYDYDMVNNVISLTANEYGDEEIIIN